MQRTFEHCINTTDELQIDLNTKDNLGWTAFHQACFYGHPEIAEMIMKNSSELKINLNIKDKYDGCTGFHLACINGHSDIAKIMIPAGMAISES